MEVEPLPTPEIEDWSDPVLQSLESQRGRMRDVLARLEGRRRRVETALQEEHLAAESARRDQAAEAGRLAAIRQELEARQAAIEARERELAARQADTEARRRLIARQLRDRHAAQMQEMDRRQAELLDQARAAPSDLQQQLQTARYCEKQLAAEVEAGTKREAELTAAVTALRATCEQLQQELTKRPATTSENAGASEDVRRRYELALEELRDLKTRNADLQKHLAQAPAGRAQPPAPQAGKLDWEAEKRRILAALETDSADDPAAAKDRVRIEDVIRKTEHALEEKDRQLAEKDREIEELQTLLKNQSENLGSVAVGAAALGELFDQDAIIREERDNLKRLQDEYREKLGNAEVELSLARADIARKRAEVEEKLRIVESHATEEAEPPGTNKGGKPTRGRWLARLGLKDLDG